MGSTIQEVPGETWCFEIMEGKRVYWLMAQSELELCSWISSLRNYFQSFSSLKFHLISCLSQGNAITLAQASVFHERLARKPQFRVDHVTKSGWLKKQKVKGWGWNRRWFLLQGEYLLYHRSPQQAPATNHLQVMIPIVNICRTVKFRQIRITEDATRCH